MAFLEQDRNTISTAGETSNEDDVVLMENRLTEPGLTMEHLVDSDIFDLDLDEAESDKSHQKKVCENSLKSEYETDEEEILLENVQQQNQLISFLQRELEMKTRACKDYQGGSRVIQ